MTGYPGKRTIEERLERKIVRAKASHLVTDELAQAALRVAARVVERPGPLGTPCWRFSGALSNGYGRIHVGAPGEPRVQRAHRVMYRVLVGEIPEGLVSDHLCRNRDCVNPRHIEPVTNKENLRRGDGYTGRRARQTRCVHGHDFTPENTYNRRNGTRRCRTCMRAFDRCRNKTPERRAKKSARAKRRRAVA